MIDPRLIRVSIPCYDGRIEHELAGSLVGSARLYSGLTFQAGCSNVALARNYAAHSFLMSHHEWMVCIDADMAFHPNDLRLLLEPTVEDTSGILPTRVRTKLLVPFSKDEANGTLHVEERIDEADALVSAEYSYKTDELRPCRLGFGFVRIHRSVFEAIRELKHEDGSPRTWQFNAQGQTYTDFFPQGALFSQLVPSASWTGEDHGFFALARIAGFVPRIEKRTQLFHIGRKAYPYAGDQGGGN